MTRINVVPVSSLSGKHLVAEYREIMRLPGNLKKSLSRSSFSMTEIPEQYVLGPGHVKFFYNKMLFLQKRFEQLVSEMQRRGYSPSFTSSEMFLPYDIKFYGDYVPTEEAIALNRERILARGGTV